MFQEHGFRSLDLSRNKYSGRFDHLDISGFTEAEAQNMDYDFHININRLSGEAPKAAKHLSRLEILAGNIWSCDSEHDLPHHDPQKRRYVCGSRTFDTALSVWGGFFFFVVVSCVVTAVLMIYSKKLASTRSSSTKLNSRTSWATHLTIRTSLDISSPEYFDDDESTRDSETTWRGSMWLVQIAKQFQSWDKAACQTNKKLNPQLYLFLQSLVNLRLIAVSLALLIAVLYLPLYVFGKGAYDFGSHTPQYRWIITAAYLSSIEASAWMAGLFVIVLLYYVVQVYRHYFAMRTFCSRVGAESGGGQGRSRMHRATVFESVTNISLRKGLIILALVMFNCAFILTLKCGFVYLIHVDAVDPSLQIFLQFALAIFDIFWNAIVLSRMVLTFPKLLSPSARIQIRLLGLVFNHILAPIVATVLSDRSCFSELFFTEAESIDTFSSIEVCDILDDNGLCGSSSQLMLSTSFEPAFSYNYQCSSSVFTVFLPVLLFTYTLTAFVEPILLILMINFVKYDNVDGFLKLIPSILWPTRSRHDEFNKVILPEILYSTQLGHIAVILTYGIASPVLGMAVALTVYIYTWQWHYIVGRYLSVFRSKCADESVGDGRLSRLSSDSDASQRSDSLHVSQRKSSLIWNPSAGSGVSRSALEFHSVLESACHDTWRGAVKSVWIPIVMSAIFMCLLLNDVGGDDVGLVRTLQLVIIPVASFALALLLFLKCYSVRLRMVEHDEQERMLAENCLGMGSEGGIQSEDPDQRMKSTTSVSSAAFTITHTTQSPMFDPHLKVLNEENDVL